VPVKTMMPILRRVLIIAGNEPHAKEVVGGLCGAKVLAGADFETCAGGVEAVKRLRQRAIDVVVTDPATPFREDLALVAELSTTRPGLKMILLAPAAAPADVIAAIRAKVFACFSAPFDWREIADMIASAFAAEDWSDAIQVVSGMPNWITLRVTCRLLTAERLVRFMSEHRSDIPGDERDRLMAAFREMLLNAMEHGAGFDPEKVVEVSAAQTSRAIVYHFRDPGDGFDRADLAQVLQSTSPEEHLAEAQRRAEQGLRPGGFGMLIAKQIVDELVYNEPGNEVLLIKYTQ
jgi:anti-sigma regulatory factor (Ser/Thr protein kinase)/ActR/RegA family two-component response regulator